MVTPKSFAAALLAASFMAFAGSAFAVKEGTFMNGQSYYGQPANAGAPVRVVDIATTNHVNVQYGETVKFANGNRTFAWTFNGLNPRAVSLAKIAPQDFGTKPLTVYVAKNPLDRR